MCQLICNCRASESRSKLYLVMSTYLAFGSFVFHFSFNRLYNRLEPTKLMCRLICNLPELNIRILIRLLPIFD